MDATLGGRIKRAMQAGFRLRIRVHAHHGKENDKCFLVGHAPQGAYAATANESAAIEEILTLRDQFYEKMQRFFTAKNSIDHRTNAIKTDATCPGTSPICN